MSRSDSTLPFIFLFVLIVGLFLGAYYYYSHRMVIINVGTSMTSNTPVLVYKGDIKPGDIYALVQTPSGLTLSKIGVQIIKTIQLDGGGTVAIARNATIAVAPPPNTTNSIIIIPISNITRIGIESLAYANYTIANNNLYIYNPTNQTLLFNATIGLNSTTGLNTNITTTFDSYAGLTFYNGTDIIELDSGVLNITDTDSGTSSTTFFTTNYYFNGTPTIISYDIKISQSSAELKPGPLIYDPASATQQPLIIYRDYTSPYYQYYNGAWVTVGPTNAFAGWVHTTILLFNNTVYIWENGNYVGKRSLDFIKGYVGFRKFDYDGAGSVYLDNFTVTNNLSLAYNLLASISDYQASSPASLNVNYDSKVNIIYKNENATTLTILDDKNDYVMLTNNIATTYYKAPANITYYNYTSLSLVSPYVTIQGLNDYKIILTNDTSLTEGNGSVRYIDNPNSLEIIGEYATPLFQIYETPLGYNIKVYYNNNPVETYIWVYGNGNLISYGKTNDKGEYSITGKYNVVSVKVEGPAGEGVWLSGSNTWNFDNNNDIAMPPANVSTTALEHNNINFAYAALIALIAIILVLVVLVVVEK